MNGEELCLDETAGNCCGRDVHRDTLMAHEMTRRGRDKRDS